MIIIKSFAFLVSIAIVLKCVKSQDDSDNSNNTNTMTVIIVVTIPTVNATSAPVANKTSKSQQKRKNVTTTTDTTITESMTEASITKASTEEKLVATTSPGTSAVATKSTPFSIPYYIPKNKLGKLFSSLCHPTCLKQKRAITQKCLKNIQLLDVYNKCEQNTGPAYSCVHCCMKMSNETSIPVNGGHYGYQISCVRRTMSRDEHICVDKYVKTVRREIRKNYGYQTARSV